jgi:hypothetical protein
MMSTMNYTKSQPGIGPLQNRTVIPVVSPFITGRNIRGYDPITLKANNFNDDYFNDQSYFNPITLNNQYGEDHPNNMNLNMQQPLGDNTMNGFFWVRNPSNSSLNGQLQTATPTKYDQYFGYNDLLRRKLDLCNFVQHTSFICDGAPVSVLDIVFHIQNAPPRFN